MGYRVLMLVAVMMLPACTKVSGCGTPATLQSLSEFVKSNIRDQVRPGGFAGGFDPFNSGLLKDPHFEAFETIRQDEDRARTSCRAIIRLDVEGTPMVFPFEYDILPVDGEGADGEADTVVALKLPLGDVAKRLKNGVLAELKSKEDRIETLEQLTEREAGLIAALGPMNQSAQAVAVRDSHASHLTEIANNKARVSRIRETLEARPVRP